MTKWASEGATPQFDRTAAPWQFIGTLDTRDDTGGAVTVDVYHWPEKEFVGLRHGIGEHDWMSQALAHAWLKTVQDGIISRCMYDAANFVRQLLYVDNEMIGIDPDGKLFYWNASKREPESCGETAEEFGVTNLTPKECRRLGLWSVYLDTGVSVRVPPGTDTESAEGHTLLKRLAGEAFARLLASGTFDILTEA